MDDGSTESSRDERQSLIGKKANLERLALIYELARSFFSGQGSLEVETRQASNNE